MITIQQQQQQQHTTQKEKKKGDKIQNNPQKDQKQNATHMTHAV